MNLHTFIVYGDGHTEILHDDNWRRALATVDDRVRPGDVVSVTMTWVEDEKLIK